MQKIIGIYRITNTITGDFYIGSSKDVKKRWAEHKCKSKWNENPNSPLYQDMQKYGVENFVFEVLEVVEADKLKEKEQQFIEQYNPTYNSCNAKGLNIERKKKTKKEYNKEYYSQLCCYNGKIITLDTLRHLFSRAGIQHPQIEAKKYLLNKDK